MGQSKFGVIALGLSLFVGSEVTAETVPRLLADFPVTQDDTLRQAFSEHIRAGFPKDIRTTTLKALLEMDGFTVSGTGEHHTARFVDTVFPCITDYTLSWGENEYGHVTDMRIVMSHKCV